MWGITKPPFQLRRRCLFTHNLEESLQKHLQLQAGAKLLERDIQMSISKSNLSDRAVYIASIVTR